MLKKVFCVSNKNNQQAGFNPANKKAQEIAEKLMRGRKRVAEQNDLLFVPLMNVFDEATKLAPPQYWLYDGVHPAIAGHELIKNEWIKNFEKIK